MIRGIVIVCFCDVIVRIYVRICYDIFYGKVGSGWFYWIGRDW